jgi:hypothetical protein
MSAGELWSMQLVERWLCLIGWVIPLVLLLYLASQFNPPIMFAGVNVTHDSAVTLARQFIWIFFGLAAAGAAVGVRRLRVVGQLVSASLYLIWRFGVGTLRHGLITDFRMKWLGASAFHTEWVFGILDVLVPVLMAVAIVLTMRRILLNPPFWLRKVDPKPRVA